VGLFDRFVRTSPETHSEAGVTEMMADGFRGRPDVDLRSYASSRGLDHRENHSLIGFLGAFPMSEELQYNVLRGELPGGEYGTVFHSVNVFEEGTPGEFYGVKASSPLNLESLFLGGSEAMFKVPFTRAAVRIPEAQGVLVGFQVARHNQGAIYGGKPKVGFTISLGKNKGIERGGSLGEGPAHWESESLDERGHDGWRAAYRGRGDREVQKRLIDGAVMQLLAQQQPARFQAMFRFGVLVVEQQQFLKRDAELDELCRKASWLAGEIRALCRHELRPLPFETEFAEPDWAEKWRSLRGDEFQGGDGQNLGTVAAVSEERGMALEDAFDFARGFCDLGFPGEPYAVMRGTLPGTGVHGRMVACLERPAVHSGLDAFLEKKVGGPFGCNVALVPVRPDAPETPNVPGETWGGGRGRYTVRRGILSVWAPRLGNHARGEEFDQLAAEAVGLAREKGLL
jgi:hypothetical protein